MGFFFFLILNDGMFQPLEELPNSVDQYFPNDQCVILQNHVWVKVPFKTQDIPVDLLTVLYM